MAEQPMPVPNERTPIVELVKADLDGRRRIGTERYGTPLQAHNGRDALRDAYEEALDLVQYLRQAIEERDNPRPDPIEERVKAIMGIRPVGYVATDTPYGVDENEVRIDRVLHGGLGYRTTVTHVPTGVRGDSAWRDSEKSAEFWAMVALSTALNERMKAPTGPLTPLTLIEITPPERGHMRVAYQAPVASEKLRWEVSRRGDREYRAEVTEISTGLRGVSGWMESESAAREAAFRGLTEMVRRYELATSNPSASTRVDDLSAE